MIWYVISCDTICVCLWAHTHANQTAYQKFKLALKVCHLISLYFVSIFQVMMLSLPFKYLLSLFFLFKTMARNPHNRVKYFQQHFYFNYLIIYTSFDGYLGSFMFVDILNKVAVNILMHVLSWVCFCFFGINTQKYNFWATALVYD